MTPPCHSFPVSQLPLQIQINVDGKKRKTDGGKAIDLSACELLDLVQYRCEVEYPNQRNSRVLCFPVQRWFRRCQDKKGSFTVETTTWEGTPAATSPTTTSSSPTTTAGRSTASGTQQKARATTYWHDGNKAGFYTEDSL
ncbi:unnamed protein product [Discula destructiva]